MNLFHELLFGGHLGRHGFAIEYERNFAGRTPDWTIMESGKPRCIVESVTHHETAEIHGKLEGANSTGVVWIDDTKRLFDKVDTKSGAYGKLVEKEGISLVASVFLSFLSGVYADEVKEIVDRELSHRPELSGVLVGEHDGAGGYLFHYNPNPAAARPFGIPAAKWNWR